MNSHVPNQTTDIALNSHVPNQTTDITLNGHVPNQTTDITLNSHKITLYISFKSPNICGNASNIAVHVITKSDLY